MDIAYDDMRRRLPILALYVASLASVCVYRWLWSNWYIGHRTLWTLSALSVSFVALAIALNWWHDRRICQRGRGFEVIEHEK